MTSSSVCDFNVQYATEVYWRRESEIYIVYSSNIINNKKDDKSQKITIVPLISWTINCTIP